jgi:GntR family transcriptional regulator
MAKKPVETKEKHPALYMQLREVIRTRIEECEYVPGSAIPSEAELAAEFSLHRLTVRSAINALVNEGLLKPVQGKGVFVVGKKLGRDLEKLTGFHQTMREREVIPETNVMIKTKRKAGLKYGKILEIAPEDSLFYIRRVCLAEEEPVSIEDIYIPCAVLSDLETIDLEVFSLYDVYKFYGIQINRAWQTLSVTKLDAKDARILDVKPETALLMFECLTRDDNNRIIEFSRSYTRGDKASFTVHYQREPENK